MYVEYIFENLVMNKQKRYIGMRLYINFDITALLLGPEESMTNICFKTGFSYVALEFVLMFHRRVSKDDNLGAPMMCKVHII